MGRESELAKITKTLEAGIAGRQSTLIVSGEPGIGKTRLLAESVSIATEHGYLTLSGRAAEFESSLPFALFIDALDDYLGKARREPHSELAGEAMRQLSTIFPVLADLRVPSGEPHPERRLRCHAARMLLRELAVDCPLLLTLDDIHWADEPSLELVAYLLRRPPEGVSLILTMRTHQMPAGLEGPLATALHEGIADRIELAPLELPEATAMLGDLNQDWVARIHAETGGNPFYLQQLARTAGPNPVTPSKPHGALDEAKVPDLVANSIKREIGLLGEREREVLQAAAIVGDPFEPDLVSEAADTSESETLAAIDQLLAASLIRATDVPRRFRFRHPLVRHAVYESAGSGWRIEAHRRTAAALERQSVSSSLRAHHVERSARKGDEPAIDLLVEAGNSTTTHAPAIAAQWYAAAIRLLPDSEPGTTRRYELLVPMGAALVAAGRLREGKAALSEALAKLPPKMLPIRGAALSFHTTVEVLLGDAASAKRNLLDALELADDSAPELRTEIMDGIALTSFFLGDVEQMRSWATRSLESEADVPPAQALGLLGIANYGLGRIEQSLQAIDSAAELTDGMADDELAIRAGVLLWLGLAEVLTDRLDDARRHLERGLDVATSFGQEYLRNQMTEVLALALVFKGETARAAELLDQTIESSTVTANDVALTFALGIRSIASLLMGDTSDAAAQAERASRSADESKIPFARDVAIGSLAEAWIECGEFKRCRELLQTETDRSGLPFTTVRLRTLLALAEIALGDLEAAERCVAEAEAVATTVGLATVTGYACRGRAELELARGNAELAVETATKPIEQLESAGAPVEAAILKTTAGRALAEAGQRERALETLADAQSTFERCGAMGKHAHVVRALRSMGRRVTAQSAQTHPNELSELSPRELEVATLAAQAHKNKEIAAKLFVSEKTVEYHLAKVYAKLGISSRVALASALQLTDEHE